VGAVEHLHGNGLWQDVRGVRAKLAAGAPAHVAIGMIDWPGGCAAAIPACRHLSALETFRPQLP
jgi:hypothetical protein